MALAFRDRHLIRLGGRDGRKTWIFGQRISERWRQTRIGRIFEPRRGGWPARSRQRNALERIVPISARASSPFISPVREKRRIRRYALLRNAWDIIVSRPRISNHQFISKLIQKSASDRRAGSIRMQSSKRTGQLVPTLSTDLLWIVDKPGAEAKADCQRSHFLLAFRVSFVDDLRLYGTGLIARMPEPHHVTHSVRPRPINPV